MESNDQFSLLCLVLSACLKKSLPTQRQEFVVLVSTLKSIIHCESIFVCGIREQLRLTFLTEDIIFMPLPAHGFLLPIEMPWLLC